MDKRIYLSPPHMGGEELELVKKVFDSNWIAPVGPEIETFERKLGEYCGNTHAAALSSGTAAIHLALKILGVGPGDIVLCQSFTFAGSANPITYLGAEPVFVDSEEETWNMSPEYLLEAIEFCMKSGKKPKAIIYVHLYGMPAKVRDIIRIANEFEIPVIEDAAESLGSRYDGQPTGIFGDISILSFNGNKIITTSGGGALLSQNKKFVELAKFFATQAREQAIHYEHKEVGYNYRLSNVCAAIGIGQLGVIEERVKAKRQIYQYYHEKLKDLPIDYQEEIDPNYSNRWLTCLIFKQPQLKEKTINLLNNYNIESRPLWKPMHMQPVYKSCKFFGSQVAENLFEKGVCVPSGSNLSPNELEEIINHIMTIFT